MRWVPKSAMAFQGSVLLSLLVLVCSAVTSSSKATIPSQYDTGSLNRSSFPAGFIFGTASSAYQVTCTLSLKLVKQYCTNDSSKLTICALYFTFSV